MLDWLIDYITGLKDEPKSQDIIQQLQDQAGKRGFTYLGRAGQKGESPEDIINRIPIGELEAGSVLSQSPELLAQAAKTMLLGGGVFAKGLRGWQANAYRSELNDLIEKPHYDVFLKKLREQLFKDLDVEDIPVFRGIGHPSEIVDFRLGGSRALNSPLSFSMNPEMAEGFGYFTGDYGNKRNFLTGKATPESILGRGSFSKGPYRVEDELLLDPKLIKDLVLKELSHQDVTTMLDNLPSNIKNFLMRPRYNSKID